MIGSKDRQPRSMRTCNGAKNNRIERYKDRFLKAEPR